METPSHRRVQGEAGAEGVAATVFAGVAAVLDELAAQAPEAKLVALSLPPLQPQWGVEDERTRYICGSPGVGDVVFGGWGGWVVVVCVCWGGGGGG